MSYQPRYDRGDWKCICDSCGRIVKASQLMKRWDGYMVDERCWEPRQPQDFVRGVADYQAPPFTRPEQSDTFIPFNWFQSLISTLKSTASLVAFKLPFKQFTYLSTTSSSASITMLVSRTNAINRSTINTNKLG